MGLIAKIVWFALEHLPSVLEIIRQQMAEKYDREMVEAQKRAVILERLRVAEANLSERHEIQHAKTEALKKKLDDLLAAESAAGDK